MADAIRQDKNLNLEMDIEGSRLTLLSYGPDRLDALLAIIEGARETVRLLFYIFKDDGTGQRVRAALLAACRRGVKVRILIDGFGSEGTSDAFFKPLLDLGCDFCRFQPRWGRRYLLRNHQKIVVADQDVVMLGGCNIEDSYFGTEESGAWRDLGILVKGSAAAAVAAYFDDMFAWSCTERARIRDLRQILERHSQTGGQLRWLYSGFTRRLSPWTRALKNDLTAGRSLDLIAAYFAPGRAMMRRIYRIAAVGQVRIVTAAKSDNGATIGAARHTYSRLLRHEVELYEYRRTRLHSKLIVIDDIVHIGSANFDMRSFYLNLESVLRIENAAFAREVRRLVDRELGDSRRITADLHMRQSGWFNRLIWSLCYFVVVTMDYNVSRRLNFGVKSR